MIYYCQKPWASGNKIFSPHSPFRNKVKHFLTAVPLVLIAIYCLNTPASGAVITEGPYVVPQNKLDMCLTSTILSGGDYGTRRLDHLDMAFSPGVRSLVGLALSYISGFDSRVRSAPGDTSLRFKYFLGDDFMGYLSSAFITELIIPTGPDPFLMPEYRNLSFGGQGLRTALTSRIDAGGVNVFQIYAGYIFRGERNENLFRGILKLPGSDDSFVNRDRLKNDYVELSLSFNSLYFFPFVYSAELYHMRRVYTGKIDYSGSEIEGLGVNPVTGAFELRYFFYREFFTSVFIIGSPMMNSSYPFFRLGFRMQHLL